jgi:septum formation protein
MDIILASNSERRKELLKLLTTNYKVIPSNIDESLEDGLEIEKQSMKLAYLKAKFVFDKTCGDRIVIGSDTMVIKNNKLYGKPKDNNDAFNMIKNLQNSMHQVITSLSVLIQEGNNYEEHTTFDIAKVYLKYMADEEILNWINSENVLDKAGGYAIQSKFSVFVNKIDGNENTIIGFPIHKLYDIIKKYLKDF